MTEHRNASLGENADPFTQEERQTINTLNTYLKTINDIDASLLADQPATDLCMGAAALPPTACHGDDS